MKIDLRLGKWQESLNNIKRVDTIITDPPFSEKVHSGHDKSSFGGRNKLEFDPITREEIKEFVEYWSPITRGWVCILTDHLSGYDWSLELERAGRYVFAPIPCVDKGSRVRLLGDGPSSWTTWLIVSRPTTQKFASWGTLPGAYIRDESFERAPIVGGKPLWLMTKIINDYTRHNDLICDPFAGSATTLIAASMRFRSSIGSESDERTFLIAKDRIRASLCPEGNLTEIANEPRYGENLEFTWEL
jgi:hypothetical protein